MAAESSVTSALPSRPATALTARSRSPGTVAAPSGASKDLSARAAPIHQSHVEDSIDRPGGGADVECRALGIAGGDLDAVPR